MKDKARINLRDASELNDTAKRLKAWIILTDNYGKPEDRYISDFVYNFGLLIRQGSFYDKIFNNPNEFNNTFLYDGRYPLTGGHNFYKYVSDLKGKTDEEIENCIRAWNEDNLNVLGDVTVSADINNQIKHPIVLTMKGTARGGWDCRVQYNPDTNKWILLEGSKVAENCVDSCPEKALDDWGYYKQKEWIDKDFKVVHPIENNSASPLANMVALASAGIYKFYIEGTKYKFVDILNDNNFYNKVMVELGYETDNTDVNKKVAPKMRPVESDGTEGVSTDMAYEQIRPNTILKENKHNLKVDIVTGKRGGCNAAAIYSYKHDMWALVSGKICSEPSKSTDDWTLEAEAILSDAIKTGKITPEFEVDITKGAIYFSSIGRVATFCRRNSTTWKDVYVHGTNVPLRSAFENKLLYRKYIDMNQDNWGDIK